MLDTFTPQSSPSSLLILESRNSRFQKKIRNSGKIQKSGISENLIKRRTSYSTSNGWLRQTAFQTNRQINALRNKETKKKQCFICTYKISMLRSLFVSDSSKPRNLKGGIGSLFDLCVTLWPFWQSCMEVSYCTFGFGAIILARFAQVIIAARLPHDNLIVCVVKVHARKATHASQNCRLSYEKIQGDNNSAPWGIPLLPTGGSSPALRTKYCISRNFRGKIFSRIWLKQTFREFLFSRLSKGSCKLA